MVKLWENVGRGKVGKKSLDCFKVMKGQKGGGGESGCVEYISLRDNRSRVSSRSCFEGSTYRSKLWLRDKFELCFVVEKKKETSLCDRYLVRFEFWIRFFFLLNACFVKLIYLKMYRREICNEEIFSILIYIRRHSTTIFRKLISH